MLVATKKEIRTYLSYHRVPEDSPISYDHQCLLPKTRTPGASIHHRVPQTSPAQRSLHDIGGLALRATRYRRRVVTKGLADTLSTRDPPTTSQNIAGAIFLPSAHNRPSQSLQVRNPTPFLLDVSPIPSSIPNFHRTVSLCVYYSACWIGSMK